MEIRICGLQELPGFLPWATHIISIRGSAEAPLTYIRKPILTLHFDDISDPTYGGCPTHHHICQIRDFAQQVPDNGHLLIHCAAGISRSAAAAIVALVSRGWDYGPAVDEVMKIRPQAHPNALMIALLKKAIGMGSEDYEELIELAKRLEAIDI